MRLLILLLCLGLSLAEVFLLIGCASQRHMVEYNGTDIYGDPINLESFRESHDSNAIIYVR